MDTKKIVENIQRICEERGTTPTVAGERSGAGKSLVSNLKQRGIMPSVEKVQLLAQYLGVTTSELLGEEIPDLAELQAVFKKFYREALKKQEAHPMNTKFEIDPSLLDDAVEVMRFTVDRCEADAAALARLNTPEARELAQARLQMAKKADALLFFFAKQ